MRLCFELRIVNSIDFFKSTYELYLKCFCFCFVGDLLFGVAFLLYIWIAIFKIS